MESSESASARVELLLQRLLDSSIAATDVTCAGWDLPTAQARHVITPASLMHKPIVRKARAYEFVPFASLIWGTLIKPQWRLLEPPQLQWA